MLPYMQSVIYILYGTLDAHTLLARPFMAGAFGLPNFVSSTLLIYFVTIYADKK